MYSIFLILLLFIRKERARTETIIGFEFIATSSSHTYVHTYTLEHANFLCLCVYVCKMMINEANFSTLFHVNMEFFEILSHITNMDCETQHTKPKKIKQNNKKIERRKTIRQLFIFVIWNSSFKKRFQQKENCLKQKKCKIISNGTVFSCFFFFSALCFTQCASAFPCASKQHVIIMPFGKCSNENENSKVGNHSIYVYLSMYTYG